MKEICVCIHGHFYQPPRENPWSEEIDLQPSAYPFHDWNERIYYECYFPNTCSRVIDEKKLITDIVNNYEWISFNFGPTLLSWLEKKYPETHAKIVKADARSVFRHRGHGNAIAQGYNHMILPLANERDKITQVRWGIEDFRHRFGRAPESLWLPETACNEETLKVLIDEGIRFILLAPSQADAIRPLGRKTWEYLSESRPIETRRVYRCFLRKSPRKFIDIFFYDGMSSLNVAFGDGSYDAKRFGGQLKDSADLPLETSPLIHIATDGETYGHHKKFANNFLAYLATQELPQRKFRMVNYAEFIQENPPQYAVLLKEGEKGEGTSWSCAHGVGRWTRNCGCENGGSPGWTQEWRKPLREALDWLRDKAAADYEKTAGPWLKNPWQARNDYIRVVLDRSEESFKGFFERNARKTLTEKEKISCMKFLEMQRFAMLMYTSCGWFFSEISGIETVQILQYAARVIELARETCGHSYEKEFLVKLAKAKSNVPQYRDGQGVYEKLVRPAMVPLAKWVASYGIACLLGFSEEKWVASKFEFECFDSRRESYNGAILNLQGVRVFCKMTREEHIFVLFSLCSDDQEPVCTVTPARVPEEFRAIEQAIFEEGPLDDTSLLVKRAGRYFSGGYYSLGRLLLDDRVEIFSCLAKHWMDKLSGICGRCFDAEDLRSKVGKLSREIGFVVEHEIRKRLRSDLERFLHLGLDETRMPEISDTLDLAKGFGIDFKDDGIPEILSRELADLTRKMLVDLKGEALELSFRIHFFAERLGVAPDAAAAQENMFRLLRKWEMSPGDALKIPRPLIDRAGELAALLGINIKKFHSVFGEIQGR